MPVDHYREEHELDTESLAEADTTGQANEKDKPAEDAGENPQAQEPRK
jgi:hypothetical protein